MHSSAVLRRRLRRLPGRLAVRCRPVRLRPCGRLRSCGRAAVLRPSCSSAELCARRSAALRARAHRHQVDCRTGALCRSALRTDGVEVDRRSRALRQACGAGGHVVRQHVQGRRFGGDRISTIDGDTFSLFVLFLFCCACRSLTRLRRTSSMRRPSTMPLRSPRTRCPITCRWPAPLTRTATATVDTATVRTVICTKPTPQPPHPPPPKKTTTTERSLQMRPPSASQGVCT